MISRKLSKKKSKRVSRKTKYSSRKRLSKRTSKRKSKTNKKKIIKKTILKGGGPYKLTLNNSCIFSFTNLDEMIKLINYIQKTFFSGPIGPEPADASLLQKQMNRQRQGIQDLKISLQEMKNENKKTVSTTEKANNAIAFIETHISNNINDKRKNSSPPLPEIQKRSDVFLRDAPFRYDEMENFWVNAILKPSETICK
jgi:hypothetical protein